MEAAEQPTLVAPFAGLHVNNDPWVPFYSAFVALWSALGLKLWERRSKAAAWRWGVSERKRKDQIRPAFKGVSPINCSCKPAAMNNNARELCSWIMIC